MHPFTQVDVFARTPFMGNPVAVVHDADDIGEEDMAAFARWTNLSETTFLCSPTTAEADYRVQIFTPAGELPFAGHPTLGSARAWLEAGGIPRRSGALVQECGIGLVDLRETGDELAFTAPGLLRSGPVDDADLDRVRRALDLGEDGIEASAWVDNGPGWLGVRVRDAETVLALRPDTRMLGDLKVGVVGPSPHGADADVEVRAFVPGLGIPEDPVTGSLNAGLAVWLIGDGTLPEVYVASQGTVLGRRGRVSVRRVDGRIWVGGATTPTVRGEVAFPTRNP